LAAASGSHQRSLISPRFSAEGSLEPKNLQPSQLPLIAEVKSRLQAGVYKLERSACPCGEATGIVISEVDRYGLPLNFVICTACGTIRIDPYLDSQNLEDSCGQLLSTNVCESDGHRELLPKAKDIWRKDPRPTKDWLRPGSLVCELGCGAGGALNVFHKNFIE
jgi:hypothetical protein